MKLFDRLQLIPRDAGLALAALLLGSGAASAAAVLPHDGTDSGAALIETALAGEAIADDELGMKLMVMPDATRASFVDALYQVVHESRSARHGLTAAQLERLEGLMRQVRGVPSRYAQELADAKGIHANTKLMLEVGLDITERVGRAGDVEDALLLAGPWPRTGEARFPARPKELTRVLSGILNNDDAAYDEIKRHFRSADTATARAIVETFAKQSTSASADTLTRCLRVHTELDGIILNRLNGVATKSRTTLHETELRSIRLYFSSPVAFEREQSAKCCGALDDIEAASALVELLADDESSVVRAAHGSLQSITAMGMGPEIRRWRSWLREQDQVWERRKDEFLSILAQPSDPRFVRTLNDIALLRLHRAELAPALTHLLTSSRHPEALRLGCAAVESLRAEAALDAVIGLLKHADDSVSERALRTLVVVTGKDLPANPATWRRVLRRR